METKKHWDSLSRLISHALRHEPWLYELELDDQGWVNISMLLEVIRSERPEWFSLTENDLEAMVIASEKQRHEISQGRIRALYGHSAPVTICRPRLCPPGILFHGTSPVSIKSIKNEGLKPMKRQSVHLSVDKASAIQVGSRKSPSAVVLQVQAVQAFESGVHFNFVNDKVWLADWVPPEFIVFAP
jgi:putative RNA 2'-phosphotransferase